MLFFRRKIALVCGISMEPLLKNGDIVFYKNLLAKEKISIGDIVIFKHPIKKIQLIKRIKAFKGLGIEVTGDNTNFSDDSNYFGLIQRETITGIVTSRISKKSISKFRNIFNLKK